MIRVLLFTLVLTSLCLPALAQQKHHFYIGVHQGAGYAHLLQKSETGRINKVALGLPTWFDLLYGNKRFRIGYRLEYLYFCARKFQSKSQRSDGTSYNFAKSYGEKGEFITNSLLLEVLAYEKDRFSIVPNITLGYCVNVSAPTAHTLEANGLSYGFPETYFQAALGLMFGYRVKPFYLYVSPNYAIRYNQPEKSESAKQWFNLLNSAGLHIGARLDIVELIRKKRKPN